MLLSLTGQIFAQRQKEIKHEVEGLSTPSDFQPKTYLSYDKQHKGDKIKLKQFFISPDISIEQDKETVTRIVFLPSV